MKRTAGETGSRRVDGLEPSELDYESSCLSNFGLLYARKKKTVDRRVERT